MIRPTDMGSNPLRWPALLQIRSNSGFYCERTIRPEDVSRAPDVDQAGLVFAFQKENVCDLENFRSSPPSC